MKLVVDFVPIHGNVYNASGSINILSIWQDYQHNYQNLIVCLYLNVVIVCLDHRELTHACYIHLYTIEAKYVYSSIK